jgi:hypothetical protein
MVQLDEMEDLLNQEQVAIGVLDAKAHELLEDAKELHVEAKACANTNIKLQEDLNQCTTVVSQWEQLVTERKQELQEKEKEMADTLEREHGELMSHAVDLSTHEAALEVEHKRVREMRANLLNRELIVSF